MYRMNVGQMDEGINWSRNDLNLSWIYLKYVYPTIIFLAIAHTAFITFYLKYFK